VAKAKRKHVPISRRVLWVFAGVTLITCAELAWWITFNLRQAHAQQNTSLQHLDRDVHLASDLIVLSAHAQGPRADLPGELLARDFPALEWRSGTTPHAELAALYPGYAVYVRPRALVQVFEEHDAHVRMFLSEGGFFLAMVLLGATLIFRTMRREVLLIRQQANFLAAVTHELKSPLASIRLYTETMQLRDAPPETRQRYLASMRADIDRLEGLVGNLLAVARLEAGEFVLHHIDLDLGREIGALVRSAEEEMRARQAPLRLTPAAEALPVRMDPGALETVLRNLLDNAAKYNAEGHGVEIRLDRQGEHAVLSVIDGGIGLPPGESGKIFQRFYRVGDEMVRQTEGSGLGLYLVQALVEGSGGEVSAHSEGPGKGCTFTVRLPLHLSEAA
jgi:two-component system sensor histidine kinase CiaH